MNIRRLFDELRIPVRRHGEHKNIRRGWIGLCCPCCGDESQFYLAFPLDGQISTADPIAMLLKLANTIDGVFFRCNSSSAPMLAELYDRMRGG